MHGITRITLILAGLLPAVHASLPPEYRPGAVSEPRPAPRSYFEARVDPRDPPALAIPKHLAEVEAYLRAFPPPGLDSARAASRAARLDDLRAYRLRGEFPRNTDFPDRPVPYFIDDRDVACAVGHLIRVSGARAFAEDVARIDNHVYLPELRDPRLGEWAYANGFTVEELARIQPSYGYFSKDILSISFDSRNRPWVVAGIGVMFNVSYYNLADGDRWTASAAGPYQNGAASFCTAGDKPLAIYSEFTGPKKIAYQGIHTEYPELNGMGAGPCVGTRNGTSFLVGGTQGMRLYSFGGDGRPALRDSMLAGVNNFPAGPVTHIAWPGAVMWAGTAQQGVAYRGAARDWTVVTYPSLGGAYLGGLKAGSSTSVWAGILFDSPGRWMDIPIFSETGLVSLGEGSPKRFHRGNSPLPSDTVFLAAPGPDGSVWLTCDRKKLLRFTPPDTLVTLAFTLPDYVHSLEVDSLNRPYLGTYAPGMSSSSATGLYRVEGDRVVPLGYPLGPLLAGAPERRKAPGPGVGFLFGSRGAGISGLDVMGRRADHVTAAGVYLSRGIGKPPQ